MKRQLTDSTCVGPTFTEAERAELRRSLSERDELLLLADLLSVAGADTRLQILYLLSEVKEMCVCDIADVLEMQLSAVSHQLRKLKDKHLIVSRRDAKTIYYSLRQSKFTDMLRHLFTLSFADSFRERRSVLIDN